MFTASEQIESILNTSSFDMQSLAKRMVDTLKSSITSIENCTKSLESAKSLQDQAQIYQHILSAYQRTCNAGLVEDMTRNINRVHAIYEMKMLYEVEAKARAAAAK